MKLAVFSAVPHEARQTVRTFGLRRQIGTPFQTYFVHHGAHEILLVQSGMGGGRAHAALEYVLKEHNPGLVVSMGFGGALYDGAKEGDLIWPSKVYSLGDGVEGALELQGAEDTARRLSGEVIMRQGTVVSLRKWMAKAEIMKVIPPLSLPVCDMETFPLADLAARRGLPFFALRSITDRADEDIPRALLAVSNESGEYRLSRSLRLLLSRPGLIARAARLGRASRKASQSLCNAVRAIVETL